MVSANGADAALHCSKLGCMTATSLYLHVPFCRQRCSYCDFFRVTDADGTHPLAAKWFDLLWKELLLWRQAGAVDLPTPLRTIYLGGGTSSLTPPKIIDGFLHRVGGEFAVAPDCEITLEMQPGTTDRAAVEALAGGGVNRFSVGAQTFQQRWLDLSGRRHSAGETRQTIKNILEVAGPAALSIDLIAAWPGQDMVALRRDVEEALSFGPAHLSVYELTFKDGTELARAEGAGEVSALSEDERAEMFLEVARMAAAAGLAQYEVSNFARPGSESRHNTAYWTLDDSVGLGAGAHSLVWPHRYSNPHDLGGYAAAVEGGRLFRVLNDASDPDIFAAENLFMALRLLRGVDMDWFAARVGNDVRQTHAVALARLQDAGMVELTGNQLRLTREGVLRADGIAAMFV